MFAVANFVVSAFRDVESHRAQTSDHPLALSVAKWTDLGVTAGTPIVGFSSVQVHMSWENTSKGWKTSWSILSFFIWPALHEWDDLLLWEISDIIH